MNSITTSFKVKVYMYGRTTGIMLGIGKRERCTVRVDLAGRMGSTTKANITRTRSRDMEYSSGGTKNITGNGHKVSLMDAASL